MDSNCNASAIGKREVRTVITSVMLLFIDFTKQHLNRSYLEMQFNISCRGESLTISILIDFNFFKELKLNDRIIFTESKSSVCLATCHLFICQTFLWKQALHLATHTGLLDHVTARRKKHFGRIKASWRCHCSQ